SDARQLFASRLATEGIAYSESASPLCVRVDSHRLVLAIVNIVFNAADALRGQHDARIHVEVCSGGADSVKLHVDDKGTGLSDEVLPHLFKPFFTTKPPGLGVGLGLALSAHSLELMSGRIVAANRPEGGTRFTLVLPLAPAQAGDPRVCA